MRKKLKLSAHRHTANEDLVFKDCWHKADLEPGASKKYSELLRMAKNMEDYQLSQRMTGPFEMLVFLGMAPRAHEHRRVIPDAFQAYAGISLFFQSDFLTSEWGKEFENSLLFDQGERAKHLPDRRTYNSNTTMPDGFWAEWDGLLKKYKNREADSNDIYPFEWDRAIRPIIAHCEWNLYSFCLSLKHSY